MIGQKSMLKRKSQVLAKKASEDMVLLDIDSGEYYALNSVGSRVWELCDGTRSVSEVISAIAIEFEAPLETVRTDVIDLLSELAEEHLVLES